MHPATPSFALFAAWTVVDWANHLWQSTVVAVAILILLMFCGKLSARTRLALGWIALLKFVLPVAALVAAAKFLAAAATRWLSTTTITTLTPGPLISMGDPVHPLPVAPTASPFAVSLPASPEVATAAVQLWLAGFVVLLGGWCIRALRARRRLLRGARLPAETVQTEIETAARLAGLKIIPRCVAVESEHGPALVGLFAPVVIVPCGLELQLTPAEFRAVLLHEFIHLRHRDHLSGALRALYVGVLWFDPAVWLLSRRLATETEKACDERVVTLTGDPETYASGIVKTVRHSLGLHEPGFAGVTTPPIVGRIQNILADRRSTSKRGLHLLVFAVTLSLIGWSGRAGSFVARATAAESTVPSSPAAPSASEDLAVRYLSEQSNRLKAEEDKARQAAQSFVALHAGEKSEALDQRAAEAATMHAAIRQRLKEVQERGGSASAVASGGQFAPIYVLRAGDLIRVQVFQREDLNQLGTVRLSAESAVMLPLIGKIDLQNKTLAQTQDLLRDRFVVTGVENARVAVSVLEYAPRSSEEKTAKEMTLSVDFPEEDIRNVLRNVAELFQLNVVIPDTLKGKVTIKLRDVTWRQIFKVALEPLGHTFVETSNGAKIVAVGAPPDGNHQGTTTKTADTRDLQIQLLQALQERERSLVETDAASGAGNEVRMQIAKLQAAKALEQAEKLRTEIANRRQAMASEKGARDTLSADFPDEDIRNVLRNVADLFELKLVMPATLRGKTTVKLNNVTWRQIFHAVLDPIGYTFVEEGATVRITEIAKPAAALNANDKSYTGVTTVNNGTLLIRANNDKIAVADETSMRTEVFLLKFARPSVARLELSSLIQSPAGKLADDERANALVVTESPAILAKIRAAVQQLDHP